MGRLRRRLRLLCLWLPCLSQLHLRLLLRLCLLDHDRLLAALDWLTVRASLVDATHSPEGQVSGEVPATGSIAEAHAAAIAALPPSLGSSVYRATRFLRYLEKSEPCRADGRAGGHCLMLARIGLEGFLLSPDDVVAQRRSR